MWETAVEGLPERFKHGSGDSCIDAAQGFDAGTILKNSSWKVIGAFSVPDPYCVFPVTFPWLPLPFNIHLYDVNESGGVRVKAVVV